MIKKVLMLDEFDKEHSVDESDLVKRTSAYGIFLKDEQSSFWRNKKVLMVQDRNSKAWEFPGGGLENDETKEEGLIREFFEETGLKVNPKSVKFFSKHDGYFYSTSFNQAWHSFRNFYYVQAIDGKLLKAGNNHDTIAAGYFSKEEVEKLKIKPKIKELVNKVFESTNFYP